MAEIMKFGRNYENWDIMKPIMRIKEALWNVSEMQL